MANLTEIGLSAYDLIARLLLVGGRRSLGAEVRIYDRATGESVPIVDFEVPSVTSRRKHFVLVPGTPEDESEARS